MTLPKTPKPVTAFAALFAGLCLLGATAFAQDAPRRFDLSCDAHSASGSSHVVRATVRFAIDLDAGSMRPYRDGKLQPSVPIQITDDQLTLRDEDQPPFGDYSSIHVRETVDRRTGAFASDMIFTTLDHQNQETRSEGQCAVVRYSGADTKPLY